jgi:hypothetical protein
VSTAFEGNEKKYYNNIRQALTCGFFMQVRKQTFEFPLAMAFLPELMRARALFFFFSPRDLGRTSGR